MIDPTEQFRPLAESLAFSGILDKACSDQDQLLMKDLEWATKKFIHVHTLLTAFMHGVMTADEWHHNYHIPPDFENVANWIAFCIQKRFGRTVVVELSLIEIEGLFREWAFQNPAFRKWNEPKDPGTVVGICSRYTPTPEERDFIALDALIRNAAVFIRNERRRESMPHPNDARCVGPEEE